MAVVGLGWAASSIWLPRLSDHDGYRVVAGVDPDAAARDAARPAVAGGHLLARVEDLPAGEIDLAVVAVPNHHHAAVALPLLERGIPTFVEKPVCLSTAEADRLAAAERSGGAALLAGSAARYRADVQALYDLVDRLGPVRHVEIAWVRARGVPGAGGWFTRRTLAGGGALVDLGWHLLDVAFPLLDDPRVTRVVGTVSADHLDAGSARAAWRGDAPPDGDPAGGAGGAAVGDVEDTARGFLVTDQGSSLALRASWASHQPVDVTSIQVEGRDAVATLRCTFGFSPQRLPASRLTVLRHGEEEVVPLPEEPIGAEYDRQLDGLPALLADPAGRGRAIEEARRTIGVIEQLYAAAHGADQANRDDRDDRDDQEDRAMDLVGQP